MIGLGIAGLLALPGASAARAEITFAAPLAAAVADPSCGVAGEAAERRWGLPPGLLAAIGRMESGRADPMTRRFTPWAWTINAQGQDGVFADRSHAVDAVRMLLMRGVRSIDIGCFQVNLMYHPEAFDTLEHGFDPEANADYAGRFLADLHARLGSWERAIAWYHSATPGLGDAYRDRVLADWNGGGLRIMAMADAGFSPSITAPPASRQGAGPRDPFVILAAAHWSGVRIWTPAFGPASVRPAQPSLPIVVGSARLPRVVTPHG